MRLFYTIILSLAALLMSLCCNAQEIVRGMVTDIKGEPVPDVRLEIAGKTFTSTDRQGRYILKCPAGKFTLFAQKEGYKTYRKQTSIQELKNETVLVLASSVKNLGEVTIRSGRNGMMDRLNAVEGTALYASKKNEVITFEKITANLATNNSRQIYNKVSGLNIWESDGSGIQLDIGGRGLSPSRTANFNTRQNGYDISADALGYPESYYTPPTEALERIEVVRGAASLQYGTQFGGMLNFVLKHGGEKPLHVKTRQTLGSFGLFNSFNSIGGRRDKSDYYGFVHYKTGNGWRPNSDFKLYTAYGSYRWQHSEKLSVKADFTKMQYVAHQAGGLTDKEFKTNPRQSNRERNWFRVDWNLASLTLAYKPNETSEINSRTFFLYAGRDALGFLGAINETDPININSSPEFRKNRDLLSDHYLNIGNETRLAKRYIAFGNPATLLTGFRLYQGRSEKKQGYANAGYGPDFYYTDDGFPGKSDYRFKNSNISLFIENLYNLSEKISVTPGLRYEYIETAGQGTYRTINRGPDDEVLSDNLYAETLVRPRSLVIAGLGVSYKPVRKIEIYANLSQNYRSITFNDFRVENPGYKVDQNLQDERGYNFDVGLRGGSGKWLAFDVTGFYLNYANRIGLILATDSQNYSVYRLRTNIGQSRTIGIETLTELRPFTSENSKRPDIKFFANVAVLNGRYFNTKDPSIENKKVELVPDFTVRTGIDILYRGLSLSWQFSYVNDHYSDATNALFTANAVSGIIPSYRVMDISAAYRYKRYKVETGCNNLLNTAYFTRRATGYPGPGIIPSDGRSIYLTIEANF